jgi:hypothetical protein
VMAARKQGRLPTEGEYRKALRADKREADGDPSLWSRVRALLQPDR